METTRIKSIPVYINDGYVLDYNGHSFVLKGNGFAVCYRASKHYRQNGTNCLRRYVEKNREFIDAIRHKKIERRKGLSYSVGVNQDYWKTRCLLAERVNETSPCDPDITSQQIEAHKTYNDFLTNNKEPK